jgi:hypothetical protein
VTPYKPQDDSEHQPLGRSASDGSDRAPLLKGAEPVKLNLPGGELMYQFIIQFRFFKNESCLVLLLKFQSWYLNCDLIKVLPFSTYHQFLSLLRCQFVCLSHHLVVMKIPYTIQTAHYFSFKDFSSFSQEILCLVCVRCHSLIVNFGMLYFCGKYMYLVRMINLVIASQDFCFRQISVQSVPSTIYTLFYYIHVCKSCTLYCTSLYMASCLL